MANVAVEQFNKPKRKWYDIIVGIILGLLFLFTLAFMVFSIIFIRIEVIGISMQPTYNINLEEGLTKADYENSKYKDKVYVNRFNKGSRGNIIVVKTTENGVSENVIKRLVAVGGDSIDIKKEGDDEYFYLYINGEKVVEDYIKDYSRMETCYNSFMLYKTSLDTYDPQNPDQSITLAQDEVFIMGDNRGRYSKDSTVYGPVKKSSIVGKVSFSVPYNNNFISYIFFGVGR